MSLTSIALRPHVHPRRALFAPDGSRFSIADDTRLVLYDRDGTQITETALTDKRPFVFGLSWSPDGVHIALAENDALRLRRASDLSIVAERTRFGRGPLAFVGSSRIALASWSELCVVEVPSLATLGSVTLERDTYESFDITHVVADPSGTFVAGADYGGYSEDEWGHTAARGIPKVTIVDAAAPSVEAHSLSQMQPVSELEIDPWRKRLVVVTYKDVVVRDFSTAQVAVWTAYAKASIKAIAVCERYVVTMPDAINSRIDLSLDFWDPVTYKHQRRERFLAGADRTPLLSMRPWWLSPSPDGSRLVVHEPDGVRVLAID